MASKELIIATFAAGTAIGGIIISAIKSFREKKHDNIDYAKKIEEFYANRDEKLVKRIQHLEEKIESLLKSNDEYKKNIEKWSNYASKLEKTITDDRKILSKLHAENEKLEKDYIILKKNCEGKD
tara:strand:+ start:933 stop:1307 length:375 start_codon:yes stop_codon:yes gene_type:complete